MISVLIVDDEILVRIGLKTIIPSVDADYRIIGEASDGKEALALMQAHPCDIVLTDIRMEGMDGLELMERIHEQWPETKVIVLSNHNDFAYVRKALQLGASEYLMKLEMDPKELMGKLGVLKEEIMRSREKNRERSQLEFRLNRYGREVKERRLRDLLTQHISRTETDSLFKEFSVAPLAAPVTVMAVQIERYERLLAENRFKSEKLLHYTTANIMEEIMGKYGNGEVIDIDGGVFALIKDRFDPEMLREMGRAAAGFIKVSLGFGVSRPAESRYEWRRAFEEAQEALGYRFYEGFGQILYHCHLPREPRIALLGWPAEEWTGLVVRGEADEMSRRLGEWTGEIRRKASVPPSEVRRHLVRLLDGLAALLAGEENSLSSLPSHQGQFPYHIVRQGETLEEISEWLSGWIPVYLGYRKERHGIRLRPEIQAVADRIRTGFHLPLKVGELAADAGFSENYLSILFKKETGQTITDYLMQVRMKKARELLMDPQIKIYEVSEKVGYADPNHFSRSFKQLEGMYPTEFRKAFLLP
ncbi:response regulator [Paenibacillus aurantius]|uniref:Response regulator n=1 Tax=Paenibacillus aurantius TaxID=2918900 RepID=A0AA96L8K8_9BACL|nr:response regulator [Paenibacillus aurantius]WNQ09036.1 response regulator [Paenibacillus aurantius]